MKKLLTAGFLFCAGCCGSVYGDEGWGPYIYQSQIAIQQASVAQIVPYYYVVPTAAMVPVVTQYAPVVRYENVMVETQHWCLLKKYQMVTVPRVVYVPVNQGPYRY
jgi:hypothetical protein